MWAGYNDQTTNPDSLAAIAAGAAQCIKAMRAGIPNVDVIMGGVWSPTGAPTLSPTMTNDTLRSVAFANDIPFVDMISGKTYDQYERVVYDNGEPWITPQNTSAFVGADLVHPNNDGHQYLAHKWFNSYTALYQKDR
jgi:lysophospholipase L1-like esterase